MAELLSAEGWVSSDSLAAYLRESLPDDYIVVDHPTIQRHTLDTLVVGSSGLFILHEIPWEGDIVPTRRGVWLQYDSAGDEVERPDPSDGVNAASSALQAFLKDEFPDLHPAIHHFLVLSRPHVSLTEIGTVSVEPPAMTRETIGQAITSSVSQNGHPALDEETREMLARALRDRKLTATQRATEPFVFRSSGLLGNSVQAWTIREAVKHMDRTPADGIYHLRNGTLARWLDEQGAEHLAELAETVMRRRDVDQQALLEIFLIGTGLVERPRLVATPPQIDLGYILAGESASGRLHVEKGRGRGYLFGEAWTNDPWLHVEPEEFQNGVLDAVVTVDTEPLLISDTPYQTDVYLDTSASEEPIAVPVQFRVVGQPASFSRYVVRPLVGALAGAAVGIILGGLIGFAASPTLAWPLTFGLMWAVMGLLWGGRLPPASPLRASLRRLSVRTVVWSGVFVPLALLFLWLWRRLPASESAAISLSYATVAVLALGFTIVPAVLDELRHGREEDAGSAPAVSWRVPARPVAVGATVVLALVLTFGWGLPALRETRGGAGVASAQRWVAAQAENLDTTLNRWIDQYYLRFYDRRAPEKQQPADAGGEEPAGTDADAEPAQ